MLVHHLDLGRGLNIFFADAFLIYKEPMYLCSFSLKSSGRQCCIRKHGPGPALFRGKEKILNVGSYFLLRLSLN